MVRHIGFDPLASFNVKVPPGIDSNLYLPFDSDLNDDSPNAFTGTAVGGASISTSVKKFGAGSLSLNGSSKYVDYGNNSAFDLGSADFTFEAWVYQNDTGSNPIFGKDAVDGQRSYYLQLAGGKITFFFTTNGSTVELYDWHNGNVTTNNWHHVAVVRSGTQLYCFLDGVSDPSPTITGGGIGTKTINTNSASFRVGNRQLFNEFFNGYIDDLRYFKGTAVYTSNFTPPTAAVGSTTLPSTPFALRSTFSVDQMREGLAAGTWPSS
jgi:hypothetical protein